MDSALDRARQYLAEESLNLIVVAYSVAKDSHGQGQELLIRICAQQAHLSDSQPNKASLYA
jgi:hypothetical protein